VSAAARAYAMDFTKDLVRSKSPCAEGFRWYVRHRRDGADYQEVLDALVDAGRVDDACWLLDKFGQTSAVLKLDQLDCSALVFAGTLEVDGSAEVQTVLRAGGSIRCGGTIRAGHAIVAGDALRAAGGVHCDGEIQCEGSLVAGGHVRLGGGLRAGDIKVSGSVDCMGPLLTRGAASVGGDLLVGGDCSARGLDVYGWLQVSGSLRVDEGVISRGGVDCGMHLEAARGIRSGGDVQAGGAIRAGESIQAAGEIRAGRGYGVFAGLGVQRENWESSARVSARRKPEGLLSGLWVGPGESHAD
jgi:hypothetical protein